MTTTKHRSVDEFKLRAIARLVDPSAPVPKQIAASPRVCSSVTEETWNNQGTCGTCGVEKHYLCGAHEPRFWTQWEAPRWCWWWPIQDLENRRKSHNFCSTRSWKPAVALGVVSFVHSPDASQLCLLRSELLQRGADNVERLHAARLANARINLS
jgi:hypothetical protein